MYSIRKENSFQLHLHNIRISEFKSNQNSVMSAPPRRLVHLPKVRMLSQRGRPNTGIRITGMKTIKPPDPELMKKQEELRLRAQLQKEIVSRSRTCAHEGYDCLLPVLTNRKHCVRHILEDPTAPYKQCVHNANGVKCTLPAPISNGDNRDLGLCFEHACASLSAKSRSTDPPPPVTTTDSLLNQLQHYVRPERTRTASYASSVSVVSDPAEQEQLAPHPVDPFKEIDAPTVNTAYSSCIMECGSGSDSDCDSITMPAADHMPANVDVEENTPLWRAGVYTAEEAVSEAKEVLVSLKSAYISQMGRLTTLLQMTRRQYIKSLATEKEQYCNINSQARTGPLTVRERRQLKKLKAYASYHRRHGVEAVLAKKLQRKRLKGAEKTLILPSYRCVFSEGGVRCAKRLLPAAKHCIDHIMLDNAQVLFRACSSGVGGATCRSSAPLTPAPTPLCRYHTMPHSYTVFTPRKDDSESDSDITSSDESQNPYNLENTDSKCSDRINNEPEF